MSNPDKLLLIIGIGNRFRSDDGIGPFVIQKLAAQNLERVSLWTDHGDPASLIEKWENYPAVILVDAVCSGEAAGQVFQFVIPPDRLPRAVFGCSTHVLNIADVIQLAEPLGALPAKIIVYGIEAKNFEPGENIGEAVKDGAYEVIERIQNEMKPLMSGKKEVFDARG